MIAYHTIIATERRTAPRELAVNVQEQLHSLGVSIGKVKEQPLALDAIDAELLALGEPADEEDEQVHYRRQFLAEERTLRIRWDAALAEPNLLYVAEWDGVAPYVTLLKGGSMDGLTMAYAGWPMIDKATYDAQQLPPEPEPTPEPDPIAEPIWPDWSRLPF